MMGYVVFRELRNPMQRVVARIEAHLRKGQEANDADDYTSVKSRDCSETVIGDGVAGAQCRQGARQSLNNKYLLIGLTVAFEVHEVASVCVGYQ